MAKSRKRRDKDKQQRREQRKRESTRRPPSLLVRAVDSVVVSLVRAVIALAELKSRDVSEDPRRAIRPDDRHQTRARTWRSILKWSPQKRVGWFVGVTAGLALGISFLWYELSSN